MVRHRSKGFYHSDSESDGSGSESDGSGNQGSGHTRYDGVKAASNRLKKREQERYRQRDDDESDDQDSRSGDRRIRSDDDIRAAWEEQEDKRKTREMTQESISTSAKLVHGGLTVIGNLISRKEEGTESKIIGTMGGIADIVESTGKLLGKEAGEKNYIDKAIRIANVLRDAEKVMATGEPMKQLWGMVSLFNRVAGDKAGQGTVMNMIEGGLRLVDGMQDSGARKGIAEHMQDALNIISGGLEVDKSIREVSPKELLQWRVRKIMDMTGEYGGLHSQIDDMMKRLADRQWGVRGNSVDLRDYWDSVRSMRKHLERMWSLDYGVRRLAEKILDDEKSTSSISKLAGGIVDIGRQKDSLWKAFIKASKKSGSPETLDPLKKTWSLTEQQQVMAMAMALPHNQWKLAVKTLLPNEQRRLT